MNRSYTIENVDLMKRIINEIVKTIDDYSVHIINSNKKVGYQRNIFALLVNRMKLNLRGIEALLNNFDDFNAGFLPIAQLARALTTDYLNFYYLQLFYSEDKSNYDFFNEMKLFDRDLYISMKDLNIIEMDYQGITDSDKISKRQKKIEEKFPDIVENGKVKSTPTLRQTSKFNFPTSFDPNNPRKSLSEYYKYKLLKEKGKLGQGGVYIFNKYFSQQYHFSTLSDNLLKSSDENFYYLIKIVGHAFLILVDYVEIMALNNDCFDQSIDAIAKKYKKLGQNG